MGTPWRSPERGTQGERGHPKQGSEVEMTTMTFLDGTTEDEGQEGEAQVAN